MQMNVWLLRTLPNRIRLAYTFSHQRFVPCESRVLETDNLPLTISGERDGISQRRLNAKDISFGQGARSPMNHN